MTLWVQGSLKSENTPPEIEYIKRPAKEEPLNVSKDDAENVTVDVKFNTSSMDEDEKHAALVAKADDAVNETKLEEKLGDIGASEIENYPEGNTIENITGSNQTKGYGVTKRILYRVYNSTSLQNHTSDSVTGGFLGGNDSLKEQFNLNSSHSENLTAVLVDESGGYDVENIEINKTGLQLQPKFEIDPGVGTVDDTFTLDAGETIPGYRSEPGDLSYNWSFGDGDKTDFGGNTTEHSYNKPGNYTVELEVDNGITKKTTSRNVAVNGGPQAKLSINKSKTDGIYEVRPDEVVKFNASNSFDPNGNGTISYVWRVNGTKVEDVKSPVSWTKIDNGTEVIAKEFENDTVYTVKLTAVDMLNSSRKDSDKVSVKAINHPPEVTNIVLDDQDRDKVVEGETVEYEARATDPDGDELKYNWSFGDGTTKNDTGKSVEYTYGGDIQGTKKYDVKVTVTDVYGKSDSYSKEVHVGESQMKAQPGNSGKNNQPPCHASSWDEHFASAREITNELGKKPYKPGYEQVKTGQPYSFKICSSTGSDDNSILSVYWKIYRDGDLVNQEFGQAISYDFPKPGSYNITADINKEDGSTKQIEAEIQKIESKEGKKYKQCGLIQAVNNTPDVKTDHCVNLDVSKGSDAVGNSLNSIQIEYPGGSANVTGIDKLTKVKTLGIDRNRDGKIDVDAIDDLECCPPDDGLIVSNGGNTLRVETSGNYNVKGGDRIVLRYSDVDNPGPGTYDVTIDLNGDVKKTGKLRIENQEPTVNEINVSPTKPKTGESVEFEANASDPNGPIVSYDWSFDGTPRQNQGKSVNHSFGNKGSHTVKVTVTDKNGGQASASKNIQISEASEDPLNQIGVDKNQLCEAAKSDYETARSRGHVVVRNKRQNLLDLQGGDYIIAKKGVRGKVEGWGRDSDTFLATGGEIGEQVKQLGHLVVSGADVNKQIQHVGTVTVAGDSTVSKQVQHVDCLKIPDGSSVAIEGQVQHIDRVIVGDNSDLTVGKQLQHIDKLEIGGNSKVDVKKQIQDIDNMTVGDGSNVATMKKLQGVSNLELGSNSKLTVAEQLQKVASMVVGVDTDVSVGRQGQKISSLEMKSKSSLNVDKKLSCSSLKKDPSATITAKQDRCPSGGGPP
ncbi:MAG: PKD domain-containing protein [Halobacteria archaeon]